MTIAPFRSQGDAGAQLTANLIITGTTISAGAGQGTAPTDLIIQPGSTGNLLVNSSTDGANFQTRLEVDSTGNVNVWGRGVGWGSMLHPSTNTFYGISLAAPDGSSYVAGADQRHYPPTGLVVKYDARGEIVWQSNVSTPDYYQLVADGIGFDNTGNVIVGYQTNGTVPDQALVVTHSPTDGSVLAQINVYTTDGYGIELFDMAVDQTQSLLADQPVLAGTAYSAQELFAAVPIDVGTNYQFQTPLSTFGDLVPQADYRWHVTGTNVSGTPQVTGVNSFLVTPTLTLNTVGSISFDGTSSSLTVAASSIWGALGTNWCIEWWSNATASTFPGLIQKIFCQQSGGTNGSINIEYNNGNLIYFTNSTGGYMAYAEPTPGQWTLVSLNNSNGSQYLYYNGVLQTPVGGTTGTADYNNNTDPILIGSAPGGSDWFSGLLTNMRISLFPRHTGQGSYGPALGPFYPYDSYLCMWASTAATAYTDSTGHGITVSNNGAVAWDSATPFTGTGFAPYIGWDAGSGTWTYNITYHGTGYGVGSTWTVSGDQLALGATPANDITLTFDGYADDNGTVTQISIAGTSPYPQTEVWLRINQNVDFGGAGSWNVLFNRYSDGWVWTPAWASLIGTDNGNEYIYAVVIGPDGHIYAGGENSQSPYNLMVKLDASTGDVIWSKSINIGSFYNIFSVAAYDNTHMVWLGAGPSDAPIVIKTDLDGNIIWTNTTTTPAYMFNGGFYSIAVEGTDIIFGGEGHGNMTIGGGDWYAAKMDGATGDMIWQRLIGTTDYDSALRSNNYSSWLSVADGHYTMSGSSTYYGPEGALAMRLPTDGSGLGQWGIYDYRSADTIAWATSMPSTVDLGIVSKPSTFAQGVPTVPTMTNPALPNVLAQIGNAGPDANLVFYGNGNIIAGHSTWTFHTDGNLVLPATHTISAAATTAAGTAITGIEAWTATGAPYTYVWDHLSSPNFYSLWNIGPSIVGWVFYSSADPSSTVTITEYGPLGPYSLGFSAALGSDPYTAHSLDYTLAHPNPVMISSNGYNWQFGTDGNLTLPTGGTINWANGSNALVGGGSTGNFLFDSMALDGTAFDEIALMGTNSANILINADGLVMVLGGYESSGMMADATDVYVFNGDPTFDNGIPQPGVGQTWQFGSDGSLTLPSSGNIVNNGNTWSFGSNGQLTFPDATTQTTAYQVVKSAWNTQYPSVRMGNALFNIDNAGNPTVGAVSGTWTGGYTAVYQTAAGSYLALGTGSASATWSSVASYGFGVTFAAAGDQAIGYFSDDTNGQMYRATWIAGSSGPSTGYGYIQVEQLV